MGAARQRIYTEDDYYNIPEDDRVELVDGQIYYQAAPSRIHQEMLAFLFKKIAFYIDANNGFCKVYPAPFAVKLFLEKEDIVEPDISVICDRDKLTDRGCTGAPDWIIEIVSPGNPEHDYIRKLNLYKDAGVREYWIVDPHSKKVLAYRLEQDRFGFETYTFQDRVKAGIYEDLWIDFKDFSE